MGDEAQSLHVDVAVGAITVLVPVRMRDDPCLFVEADGLGRHAGAGRHFADCHRAIGLHHGLLASVVGRQRRSSKAFDTTLTDDKAMAASANTGFKRPNAARGSPITL